MGNPPARRNHGRDRERPRELEAVKTTIVGGRPPGSGRHWGEIPRGIEVLVKKASIDPAFRELLLVRRADAAREIELTLDPAEIMILENVPREQLEAIIDRTEVDVESRSAFLGRAATVMLAALGVGPLIAAESGREKKADPAPAPEKTDAAKGEATGETAEVPAGKVKARRYPTAREMAPKKLVRSGYAPPTEGIDPTPPPTRGIQPTPTPTPTPTPEPTPTPPPTLGITPEPPSGVKRWRRYK